MSKQVTLPQCLKSLALLHALCNIYGFCLSVFDFNAIFLGPFSQKTEMVEEAFAG